MKFILKLRDPPPGLKFVWEFGDHTPPADGMSAVHTYRDAGQYQATLTITGPDIEDTEIFVISATEQDLEVTIEADPDIGPAPLTTRFNAVVLEEVESDAAFEWDFGDGNRGAGKNCSHTYEQSGEYTASLVVRMPNGRRGAADVLLDVYDPSLR